MVRLYGREKLTEDLVWLAEAECHAIALHQLAILLGTLPPHVVKSRPQGQLSSIHRSNS